jgi:cellulose synthase/poly-beta-1,6-N-acetylglucosamine synthase-like glycosyltransferase
MDLTSSRVRNVTVFLVSFLLLGALYVLITAGLTIGLGRKHSKDWDSRASVTVLICAHNESERIGACLAAIADQTYDYSKTEVIVIDDRSEDHTGEIARSWTDRIPNLRVLQVEKVELACPKKNALSTGMAEAKGDLILTTDADCKPAPGWIASTVASFSEKDTGVVIGPAPLTGQNGRISPLLVFQGLLVNALAAGSAGIGIPLTCSGRNLAFRRTAYDQSGGYGPIGHITGGDDVLLMRRIKSIGWKVVFNLDPDAEVTSPAHNDAQWSRQARYQSKAKHYGICVLSVATLMYILHLILFASPAWIWLAPGAFPILLLVFVIKAVADGAFLWRAAKKLGYRRILRWFPLVEVLLVPYITIFCAAGTLRRPTWN